MKKLFKYLFYFMLYLIFLYIVLFVYNYYKTHYKFKIDNQFSIVDYYNEGEGFYLLDTTKRETSAALIVNPPIVWYCVAENYIIGCTGKDISNESESYIPSCQKQGYFIFSKNDTNITKGLSAIEINTFMQSKNLKCIKQNIY